MLSIVTAYLLQARHCALPGIGEFLLNTKSASLDIVHKQLHPPVDEILFIANEAAVATPGLIRYIALKREEDVETAGLMLINYCEEWIHTISKGELINMHPFGTLQKNAEGIIFSAKPILKSYTENQ